MENPHPLERFVILLVEDDPFLRMAAIDLIEDAGFEAAVAENGDEAIHILETRSDVRIVFTDIQMPGTMDGMKLARTVRGRWPEIKLVITSGKYEIRNDELPDRSEFFRKPYKDFEVAATFHRMMA
jgi:CheY-like chemotaxis protein